MSRCRLEQNAPSCIIARITVNTLSIYVPVAFPPFRLLSPAHLMDHNFMTDHFHLLFFIDFFSSLHISVFPSAPQLA